MTFPHCHNAISLVNVSDANETSGIELLTAFSDAPFYYATALIINKRCVIYNHDLKIIRFIKPLDSNTVEYIEVPITSILISGVTEMQAVCMLQGMLLFHGLKNDWEAKAHTGSKLAVNINVEPIWNDLHTFIKHSMGAYNFEDIEFFVQMRQPVKHLNIKIGSLVGYPNTFTEGKTEIKVMIVDYVDSDKLHALDGGAYDGVDFKSAKCGGFKYVMFTDDLDSLFLFNKHGADLDNVFTRDALLAYHADSVLVFHDEILKPILDPKIC